MHNRIRQARTQLGLSQREVADKLGKHPSAMSMWESGERTPDAYTVFELADLLGVSAYWLVKGSLSPDLPNFIEYNDRHLVVVPVVDKLSFDNKKKKFTYHVLGASAYENTMPFYNQFSKDVLPDGLLWVVTDMEDRAMVGLGIYPASVVLVSMNDEVKDGTVALILQDEKAICRKIYYQGENEIRLGSAHPYAAADKIVESDQIKIAGKVLATSTLILQ